MRFSLATIIFFAAVAVNAAPIDRRQGAGVGAGCDSIFSDTDTMIGESSRGAGKTIAQSLQTRQGAGFGAACNSIFSDTDTMIGESSRGAGKTIANDLSGKSKRQLNGIADGVTAIPATNSALEPTADSLDSQLNTLDGEGTDGSAQLGQAVGDLELQVGTVVGGTNGQSGGGTKPAGPGPKPKPKRQLNGIADGVTAPLANSPQTSGLGSESDAFLNTVDGQGTDDSAEAGQIVGDEELQLGKTIGGSNGQSGGSKAAPAPAPKKGPK